MTKSSVRTTSSLITINSTVTISKHDNDHTDRLYEYEIFRISIYSQQPYLYHDGASQVTQS